jgi:perosamine synthetase
LIVSDIKPGEYVLIPTMTFASTAEILYYNNVRPILVDCREDDLTIDPVDTVDKLHRALNEGKRVTGIIPVHYAGKMVNMDWVDDLSGKFGLTVIEDAAHCCGSQFFSEKRRQFCFRGESSLTQCYSFYCNKCITSGGEGGMVVTQFREVTEKLRLLSLHGLSSTAWERFSDAGSVFYDILSPGYKYNLTDLGAAVGVAQLQRNDVLWDKRVKAVARYKEALKTIPEMRFLEDEAEKFRHSYHLFVVKVDTQNLSGTRNDIVAHLKEKGITPSVHWKPLHLHSFYRNQGFKDEDYPVATKLFDQIISLPLYSDISVEEIDYVVEILSKYIERHRR